jgi:hypothetical protein
MLDLSYGCAGGEIGEDSVKCVSLVLVAVTVEGIVFHDALIGVWDGRL